MFVRKGINYYFYSFEKLFYNLQFYNLRNSPIENFSPDIHHVSRGTSSQNVTEFREFERSAMLTCESTIFMKLYARKHTVHFFFWTPRNIRAKTITQFKWSVIRPTSLNNCRNLDFSSIVWKDLGVRICFTSPAA